jgi:diaminohydroxyphosphoribosylaminopyrimidine deaminase/5-amino-6-(5-phosphoribosylamino)uracil reductase
MAWSWLLAARDGDVGDSPGALRDLPLFRRLAPVLSQPPANRPLVVAHVAQSLDGRIALPCGASQWITGEADLDHTHQLRAICDAVLVGATTVERDDPQLTVRRASGPSPLRVVLDPRGRLAADRKVFTDGASTLRVVRRGCAPALPGVDALEVDGEGPIDLPALLATLRARGVRRLFVEGGGVTLGHLLAARVVDRLHLVMAPTLLGQGTPSVFGDFGVGLAACPKPSVVVSPLGDDWLFDCSWGVSA